MFAEPTSRHRLRLHNVTRRWGERVAVDNVSLAIEPKEKIALIGPSGGGKSTLIKMLAGALRPSDGQVYVDDKDIAEFSPGQLKTHRRCCGIVEQSHLLIPQLSVHQNVIAGQLAHWPWYKTTLAALWPIHQKPVRALLDELGIGEYQWELVNHLSGGQMQRVTIARALISQPYIILADEATASLDPATAKSVSELIIQQANSRGSTLVFCTHWVDLVLSECDWVIGLRDGAVQLNASPAQISDTDLEKLYAGSNERI